VNLAKIFLDLVGGEVEQPGLQLDGEHGDAGARQSRGEAQGFLGEREVADEK
jgi:hypothetical protein